MITIVSFRNSCIALPCEEHAYTYIHCSLNLTFKDAYVQYKLLLHHRRTVYVLCWRLSLKSSVLWIQILFHWRSQYVAIFHLFLVAKMFILQKDK